MSRACTCYHGCEAVDVWHQHDDDPCPRHPDRVRAGTEAYEALRRQRGVRHGDRVSPYDKGGGSQGRGQ